LDGWDGDFGQTLKRSGTTRRNGSYKLKVLWLARTIPFPTNTGDRIYSAGLANSLADAGADVTYMALRTDAPENDSRPYRIKWKPINSGTKSSLSFLFSTMPMAAVRHRTRVILNEIRSSIQYEQWDAVIVDHYSMGWCMPIIENVGFAGCIVYVGHNYERQVTRDIADAYDGNFFKKRILLENSRRTADIEAVLIKRSDLVVALTEHDRSLFQAEAPNVDVLVLPPGYSGARSSNRQITSSTPRKVIAVGSFEWTAKQLNLVKFLRAADSKFAEQNIELHIIGKTHKALKRELGSLKATKLRGFVDDILGEFANARIALVFDETGGGFKLKMLDYAFSRVPIFGLSHALEGLPEQAKPYVVMAQDMSDLADKVVLCLDDLAKLNQMHNGAFAAMEEAFSWEQRGTKFKRKLELLLARKAGKHFTRCGAVTHPESFLEEVRVRP
jgi:glycosyltransferase involved in cell wall biosynthesis